MTLMLSRGFWQNEKELRTSLKTIGPDKTSIGEGKFMEWGDFQNKRKKRLRPS